MCCEKCVTPKTHKYTIESFLFYMKELRIYIHIFLYIHIHRYIDINSSTQKIFLLPAQLFFFCISDCRSDFARTLEFHNEQWLFSYELAKKREKHEITRDR